MLLPGMRITIGSLTRTKAFSTHRIVGGSPPACFSSHRSPTSPYHRPRR